MSKTKAKKRSTAFDRLSPQHKVFVVAFFGDFNATRAYIAAGYSANGADVSASRLLGKAKIQAAVKEQLEALGITAERIKCDLAEIAFGADIADLTDFLNGRKTLDQLRKEGVDTRLVKSASHATTLQGHTQRVEMYDRLTALDKLARVIGMITDKQEVTHTGAVNVVFDESDPKKLLEKVQAAAADAKAKADAAAKKDER